jgi:D-alanyl-D-alanine carboxypeptidase (penicillin-binding protein 5/6)
MLLKAGQQIADAEVWLGVQPTVPLVAGEDVVVTVPTAERDAMKVTVSYDGPIPAPIAKGTAIAQLGVEAPDVPTLAAPLMAGDAVERLGFFGRIGAALHYLLRGQGK